MPSNTTKTTPLIRLTLADFIDHGGDTEKAVIALCDRDGIPCVQPGETLMQALRRAQKEQEVQPDELEIVDPSDVPTVVRGAWEHDADGYTGAWDSRKGAIRHAVEFVLPTVAEWRANQPAAEEFAIEASYGANYDEAAWAARDAEANAAPAAGAVISAPYLIPDALALFAAHAPEMPRWFAKERGCYDDRGDRRIGPQADELWFRAGCEWRWYYADRMIATRKAGAA